MKNKAKNISVISTGSWVPSNLNDQEKNNFEKSVKAVEELFDSAKKIDPSL